MGYLALFIALCALPAVFVWRNERRLRKLAQSRLGLAFAVSEMEQVMLDGDITIGDVSHDILFRHMQRVQNSDVFEVDWAVLKSQPRRVRELQERLRSELDNDDCKFAKTANRFMRAYFTAFRLKHPFKSFAYIVYLQFLRHGLKCVFVLAMCLFHALRFIQRCRASRKAVYQESALAFFPCSVGVWKKTT
tara:strand:+ start:448 stop:1020 length:573 start_codon:yes stop_codon:yes gene_type:complete